MFRAGDREAEDPEAPPCEGRARRRVNRGRLFAGRSHRRDVADPCGSAPRADAAPLSNASGSAPSRTGRAETRMKFHSVSRNFFTAEAQLTGRAVSLSAKLRGAINPEVDQQDACQT